MKTNTHKKDDYIEPHDYKEEPDEETKKKKRSRKGSNERRIECRD